VVGSVAVAINRPCAVNFVQAPYIQVVVWLEQYILAPGEQQPQLHKSITIAKRALQNGSVPYIVPVYGSMNGIA